MNNDCAKLSSEPNYTLFSFGNTRLKFAAPYSLQKYESVVSWDNGYLVVMTNAHNSKPEEEYIDLLPVLKDLYIDPETYLKPIKRIEVCYESE